LSKPILVLDFDGVIHGYQSGWKGAANIPDPPVPGALEFIVGALDKFEVHILSSRSHQWGGRRAMKRWLWEWLVTEGDANPSKPKKTIPEWWQNYVAGQSSMEPWCNEVRNAAHLVVRSVKWPTRKPAALYTIDDRAHQFDGSWPALETIAAFKPWNKRAPPPSEPLPETQGQSGSSRTP